MWAADAYRMLSTNTRQLSSSFLRQLLGQPRMIVFGFMPPRPAVWILERNEEQVRQIQNLRSDWIGSASQVAHSVRDVP